MTIGHRQLSAVKWLEWLESRDSGRLTRFILTVYPAPLFLSPAEVSLLGIPWAAMMRVVGTYCAVTLLPLRVYGDYQLQILDTCQDRIAHLVIFHKALGNVLT